MTALALQIAAMLIVLGIGEFLIESLVPSHRMQTLLRLTLLASVLGYLAWAVWR